MTRVVGCILAVALACSGAGAEGRGTSRSAQHVAARDSEPTFAFVSAGGSMTCALTTQGNAYCWGSDADGQLGDGARQGNEGNAAPLAVAGNHRFTAISAGDRHVCAVTTEGAAYCWGKNMEGALGSDTAAHQQAIPTLVSGGLRFRSISAGWDRTCAVTPDGRAYCWGRHSVPSADPYGRAAAVPTPVPGAQGFRSTAVASGHACGIGADSLVYCWGQNDFGVLGRGSTDRSVGTQSPGPPTLTMPVANVSVSTSTSCVVTLDGVAYCWGSNQSGALGNGTSTDEYTATATPSRVVGDQQWRQISTAGAYTCAVTLDGAAYCWGSNGLEPGRGLKLLGSDAATDRCGAGPRPRLCSASPLPVAGGLRFRQVSAGAMHACGVTEDGRVYCWGANEDGELGNGSSKAAIEPTRIVFPAPAPGRERGAPEG